MASDLTVTGQTAGAQATTQNPQTLATNSSSGVQPGTASDLLRSSTGQTLLNPVLPTVNLSQFQSQPASNDAVLPPARHIHVVDFAIPVVLIIVAVWMFWFANRMGKNTTEYS